MGKTNMKTESGRVAESAGRVPYDGRGGQRGRASRLCVTFPGGGSREARGAASDQSRSLAGGNPGRVGHTLSEWRGSLWCAVGITSNHYTLLGTRHHTWGRSVSMGCTGSSLLGISVDTLCSCWPCLQRLR